MKIKSISQIGILIMSLCFIACSNNELNDLTPKEVTSQKGEVITLKSGAKVTYFDQKYIWEGDMILSTAQLKSLEEIGDILDNAPVTPMEGITVHPLSGYCAIPENLNTKSTAIYPTTNNTWAMVRFTYAKSGSGTSLNLYTKTLIQEALRYWEAHTNIRFYNATNEPTIDPDWGFAYPYVNFCDGKSNSSYVGLIGGRQDLTLVPYGCTVGTIIHEIGHAIGLLHEQCRFDRDNYINVNINNVAQQNRHNYDKRTTNYNCIGSFDFESIMLYSSFDFAVNPSTPVLTKKDGSTFEGQRQGLSDLDKMFPNKYYLPYIARRDVYRELAEVVYKPDNTIMSAQERLQLQASLNKGNPNPPAGGRIPNNF